MSRGNTMDMPTGNGGLNPWAALMAVVSSVACGAMAGFAVFCQSEQAWSTRKVFGAVAGSAIWAGGTAAMVFAYFPVNEWSHSTIWLAIGVSALSGVGGNTSVGFVFEVLKFIASRKP